MYGSIHFEPFEYEDLGPEDKDEERRQLWAKAKFGKLMINVNLPEFDVAPEEPVSGDSLSDNARSAKPGS
jgi:hypothetical protein